jgi:hypothetical protein
LKIPKDVSFFRNETLPLQPVDKRLKNKAKITKLAFENKNIYDKATTIYTGTRSLLVVRVFLLVDLPTLGITACHDEGSAFG